MKKTQTKAELQAAYQQLKNENERLTTSSLVKFVSQSPQDFITKILETIYKAIIWFLTGENLSHFLKTSTYLLAQVVVYPYVAGQVVRLKVNHLSIKLTPSTPNFTYELEQ